MKITEYIQKHKKLLSVTLFLNALLTLFILGIVVLVVGVNRGDIFSQFASDYAEQKRLSTATSSASVLGQESRIIDIVKQANPAVVSVIITKNVPVYERGFREFGPFQIPQLRQQGTEEQKIGEGSGFIVSEDGLVVTNRHVVSDRSASYSIVTKEGETLEAEVVARDRLMDIAVMRIKESGDYPHLAFGNSNALQLGQTVIAIGNALAEFRNTVSTGVVSGLSRSIVAGGRVTERQRIEGLIQTDAAINPGNSGGPLLDLSGNVVGVNVAVAQGSENIGFALPANEVKYIVNSVKKHGEIVRPYLGVRYLSVNKNIKEQHNLSVDYGALIVSGRQPGVLPDSPADTAGVRPGDVIIKIDGTSLKDKSLSALIRRHAVGEIISLTILRDGKRVTKEVTLQEAPDSIR